MSNLKRQKQGFSLVEISIVIIIIGILIAGISSGYSLLETARFYKLISDVTQYRSAFLAFKDRYNEIPGDMMNATAYWGAAGVGNACITAIPVDTQTCNGNGYIDEHTNETLRAWQHLANSGLVAGSFNGVSYNNVSDYVAKIGINIPASPIRISGYNLASYLSQEFPYIPANLPSQHNLFVGGGTEDNGAAAGSSYIRMFTPAEAYLVDAKIDDGKPATGMVYTNVDPNLTDSNCFIDFNNYATSDYNLSYQPADSCMLNFIMPLSLN